ncbi:unnamed protein product, partial [Brassica rapa subsp. narinosa]
MCPFSTNIHFDYDGHILRMEMIMNGFQPMLVCMLYPLRH